MSRFEIIFIAALLPMISLSAAENSESTPARPRIAVDRSLPPEPNAVFTSFIAELNAADWDKALEYCSAKVRAKAAEYDSADAFFNTVLPLSEVTSLTSFSIRTTASRNNKPTRYGHEIELKDTDYSYPVEWYLSLIREDLKWVADFPAKPLDIWMKQAVLISKKINQELEVDYQKNRAGLQTHLVALSNEFAIGRPMLFSVQLRNISTETLFYMNTAYMVNDPLIIKDAAGATVPFIGGSSQTAASDACIEPNETITLVDRYDMRSQYHLVKPGKYSFQFKNWSIPSSNVVEMEIKDGPLSPLEESVEAIRTVLPQAWRLSRRLLDVSERPEGESGEVIMIYLVGKQARKASTEKSIAILVTILVNPDSNAVSDRASKCDFRGRSRLGAVFVKSINAEELWPDYREQLIKAMGIDVQKQP
ncbi:MAG: hypothetical protein LLF76_09460 [Planctomycetaceae bacterium]|nr:hypothetical protein [Planctomycetaceae bacterium]